VSTPPAPEPIEPDATEPDPTEPGETTERTEPDATEPEPGEVVEPAEPGAGGPAPDGGGPDAEPGDVPVSGGAGAPVAGAARPGRRRRVMLAGLAGVVLLAVVAGLVVGVQRWNDPTIPPTATHQDLGSLPTPGRICRVQVTDQGWSVARREETIRYAAVLRNPCPDGAYAISVRVRLRPAPDRSAGVLGDGTDVTQVQALAPGAETAITGEFVSRHDSGDGWLDSVTGVSVRVVGAGWIPVDRVATAGKAYADLDAPLHTTATIRHLRVFGRTTSARGYQATARLGFELHLDHRSRRYVQYVVVVLRDRRGRILAGDLDPVVVPDRPMCDRYDEAATARLSDGRCQLDDAVRLPPGTDLSRLELYWQPRLDRAAG
jgi:hypothetical protein